MREQEFFRGDVAGLSARDFDGESIKDRTELPDKFPKTGLKENFRKKLRRGAAAAMAMVALSGPIASHAEEAPVPEVTDTAVVVTPEPTAEVKAEVTAAVKDPEAKVSMEDLKAIFESYKRNLFAPYKQELKDLGCENEARIDFCSKLLYSYDGESKDEGVMKVQNIFKKYITRSQIISYAKTGSGLEVLTNENGDPRMLMVNSTEKITQGVIDSIKSFKDNGCTNIQEVLYNNGAVIYLCADLDNNMGFGTYSINEFGTICSQMSPKNTADLDPVTLERTNTACIYVESIGIAQQQMRRAVEDMWYFGSFVGDVEVTKQLLAGYAYLGLYDVSGFIGFSLGGSTLIGTGVNTFAPQYDISPTDPRIEKQVAMLTVVTEPLTGLDWDDVPEIKQMRETYLTSN